MSYKRSRATYEADLTAQQSPYVVFGTPLPPLDPDVRDDGSYVPVWKQEVRDDRGRKRLHGAFTGGWSAGYFNTVGSKEGWTPSTFVSSRTNRRKDDASAAQQRPEDFMDEEDLQDAEEARKIQTNAAFAGLGSAGDDGGRASGLMGIFRTQGETAGTKLLRRMGWKEGQGIGPKIRRRARLDTRGAAVGQGAETYLFAPENVVMIRIVRKTDRRGLGYDGQPSLGILGSTTKNGLADQSDDEDADEGGLGRPRFTPTQKPGKAENQKRGGIGMGILNDTGSDDEDPYEIGPRISYNRVIGGDKKKKKKGNNTSANPSVKSKPTFLPNRSALGRVGAGLRKGHDGKLPLDGFVFGQGQDSLTLEINSKGKFPPPAIPEGWKSSKLSKSASDKEQGAYVSTADAAKASKMDPKARAALLGEKQLPGKSIFDFMSASSRERLVAVTGNANLPQAKGEMPAGSALTEEERFRELMSQVPKLDKETAVAAIARGAGGGGPYSDDEAKRTRFRAYLELQAGFSNAPLQKPPKISNDDWIRELHEFFNCARIFKPMTGMMASRFTTSSAASMGSSQGKTDDRTLVSKPAPAPQDPAEEAARLGMFGQMTRTVADFYPTRLLCKRFGVRPPAHVQPDQGADTATSSKQGQSSQFGVYDFADPRPLPLAIDFNGGGGGGGASTDPQSGSRESPVGAGLQKMPDQQQPVGQPKEPVIDSSRNEALEAQAEVPGNPTSLKGQRITKPLQTQPGNPDFQPKTPYEPTPTATLSDSRASSLSGQSVSSLPARQVLPKRRSVEEDVAGLSPDDVNERELVDFVDQAIIIKPFQDAASTTAAALPSRQRSPPPQYPASEASSSGAACRPPPSFSSLFTTLSDAAAATVLEPSGPYKPVVVDCIPDHPSTASPAAAAPAYAPADSVNPESSSSDAAAAFRFQDETKRALPQDTKGESSRSNNKDDDAEPPPAYSEGPSPLKSFTYLMAAAGGASSIITQVQQGGPPINPIGDVGADEMITMDLRGTRFTLSRDELLTLPEFVLLSLFPNGLFPEGHMGGFSDGDAVQVDYDPASLQYMLDFFRTVAQSIPSETSPSASQDGDHMVPLDPSGGRDDGSKRAGIIVLREDLDFYAIPPRPDIEQSEMIEVKRAAARALLKQGGIFSGLKRSDEPGTTEAHLIEMLTAGGFNHDDQWGHRAGEPNKAVICSLALARLRSDIRGNDMGNNAVGMAQKLLLFWRKPARRCWWEGVDLENVEGVEGKTLKVWIRRVWTLEMSVIGLR